MEKNIPGINKSWCISLDSWKMKKAKALQDVQIRTVPRRRKMRGDPVYNETRMEIKEKERKRKEGAKSGKGSEVTFYVDADRNIPVSGFADLKSLGLGLHGGAGRIPGRQALLLGQAVHLVSRHHQYARGVELLQQGMQLGGSSRVAARLGVELAACLSASGSPAQAEEVAATVRSSHPKNLDALYAEAEAALGAGSCERALVLFLRGIRIASPVKASVYREGAARCKHLILRQIGNILDGPEEPWQQRFLHLYNVLNHQ